MIGRKVRHTTHDISFFLVSQYNDLLKFVFCRRKNLLPWLARFPLPKLFVLGVFFWSLGSEFLEKTVSRAGRATGHSRAPTHSTLLDLDDFVLVGFRTGDLLIFSHKPTVAKGSVARTDLAQFFVRD